MALMNPLLLCAAQYLPDFKFWTSESSQRYAKAKDYPDRAKEAIKEMHRQASLEAGCKPRRGKGQVGGWIVADKQPLVMISDNGPAVTRPHHRALWQQFSVCMCDTCPACRLATLCSAQMG